MLSLVESFIKRLKDPRRPQGQRYPFLGLLTMIVIGCCRGYTSLRGLTRFMKNNAEFFSKHMDLPHGTPSKSGLEIFLNSLNKDTVLESFNEWLKSSFSIEGQQWISGDGKALRSTITNANDSNQNVLTIISLYCRETGIALLVQQAERKQKDEIAVMQDLIEKFSQKGVIFTFDALHCQKKH